VRKAERIQQRRTREDDCQQELLVEHISSAGVQIRALKQRLRSLMAPPDHDETMFEDDDLLMHSEKIENLFEDESSNSRSMVKTD